MTKEWIKKYSDARYIVMLAVMTALAVTGRVAFFWIPHFKPMAGFVVISGMAFGPFGGFICGALSMLISNIFFGQGPWTIFQMLAYGLIGLVSGLLKKGKILSIKNIGRLSLSAVVTFVIILVISSAVLDTASIYLMSFYTTNIQALTVYALGLYPNAMNGLCGAITVFILTKPIMSIIRRISKKYGISGFAE